MYRTVLLVLVGCIGDNDERYNVLVPWDLGPGRAHEGDAVVLPDSGAPDNGSDDTCEPAECGDVGGAFLDGPMAGDTCFCQAPCEAFGTCCRNVCAVCPDACPELPGLSVDYSTGRVVAHTITLWMILVDATGEVVEECAAENSSSVRCEPTSSAAVESDTEVLLVARFVQPNGRDRWSCTDSRLVGRYEVFWRLVELSATGTVPVVLPDGTSACAHRYVI